MSSKTSSSIKQQPQQPLSVPPRFGIVEQGVYRSNTPLPAQVRPIALSVGLPRELTSRVVRFQIPFLKTLALKTIISLTPEASHPTLSAFYTQNGIDMVSSWPGPPQPDLPSRSRPPRFLHRSHSA